MADMEAPEPKVSRLESDANSKPSAEALVSSTMYMFKREGPGPLYTGPVKACILDWSGTLADRYVLAPVVVFVEVFKKYGISITMEEARKPMGIRKDLHIKAVTEMPRVREEWKKVHGKYPSDEDVKQMFKDAVPLQLECLKNYTTLLPGVLQAVDILQKKHNVKVGCTTGFITSMADIMVENGKKQGLNLDAAFAGDSVKNGSRPKPFMLYKNLDELDVLPIQSVVKVDDTISGILEGINAGCWTVGVARYSNYMNIDSIEHEKSLTAEEMEEKLNQSRKMLEGSGAHYVIDSLTYLPKVVEEINDRLSKGERP